MGVRDVMPAWPVVLAVVQLAACGGTIDATFCSDSDCALAPGEWQRIASLSPLPPPRADPSNRFADDPMAAALGKRLYFEPDFAGPGRRQDSLRRPTILGVDVNQPTGASCASCHDVSRGGVDTRSPSPQLSVGAGVTDVNAPPTINAAQHGVLFWNGRVDSLWGLNLVVSESELTMNGNRMVTAHLLADRYGDALEGLVGAGTAGFISPDLPPGWRAKAALLPPAGRPGRQPGCQAGASNEPFGDAYDCASDEDRALADRLLVLWAKLIASYERQLVSTDSAFDAYVAGGPSSRAISPAARRGARLFVGKASCIDCHNGPLLSDDDFHDIGVPQIGAMVPTVAECTAGSPCDCVLGKDCLPWGAYNGQLWSRDVGARWRVLVDRYRDDKPPPPQAMPLPDEALKGAWRTPSLRDVALTAPYMHNGAFRTLEEVVRHYNGGARGSRAQAVGTLSVKIKPLALTDDEMADLVEFLRALTGEALPPELGRP
jgi:cytochrome c peroxidase